MWLVEVNSDHFLLKGIFECVVFMAKDNNRFYNNNNNNNNNNNSSSSNNNNNKLQGSVIRLHVLIALVGLGFMMNVLSK